VPEYNPVTPEKIELGRRLFYDVRLSANQAQSCASCHRQEMAFSDGVPTPHGSTGQPLVRNSQGLANAAYFSTLTWGNNALLQLEDQIRVPILSDNPVELGVLDGVRGQVLQRFDTDTTYRAMFTAAFPGDTSGATINKITYALASFSRMLVSGDSPYDRYYRGNPSALTAQQVRGLRLFNSERLECFHCHSGLNFSTSYHDEKTTDGTITYPFFNNGLYNIGGDGGYPSGNQGLYEVTGNPADRGRFRPAGLRNVAVTAPYMHDGSIATLSEVLDHYAKGGRARSFRTDPLLVGFTFSDQERADVIAFLESLTDREFITNPKFTNPWPAEPPQPTVP
jgi:cytochrome c peroxidase